MENIVDFDVEICLDYVLDNVEVKKYEEEEELITKLRQEKFVMVV